MVRSNRTISKDLVAVFLIVIVTTLLIPQEILLPSSAAAQQKTAVGNNTTISKANMTSSLGSSQNNATNLARCKYHAVVGKTHFFLPYKTNCVTIQPSAISATVGPLTYHGGVIMHNPVFYLIFWLPTGYSFDTSNVNYEDLIKQYFVDVCSTPYSSHFTAFYTILQQYPDSSSSTASCSFGQIYVDTNSFPSGRGTQTNPLQDSDIQHEVTSVMNTEGWSSNNGNNEFFVFTPNNIYSCDGSYCNFGTNPNNIYCAYHSYFSPLLQSAIIYSSMPDAGSDGCTSIPSTPNNDLDADAEINILAHEQFESITDPQYCCGSVAISGGWYYQNGQGEIGDECAWNFGYYPSDGSTVLLNGNKYSVQQMWSNLASGCILPPRPQITSVNYPSSITLGQSATITINTQNIGGESTWETAALSFPTNPPLSDVQITTSDLSSSTITPTSTSISGCYSSCTITTIYPLVQGQSYDWLSGTSHSITTSVTPTSTGQFTFYVKSVAATLGTTAGSAWDPTSLSFSTEDQQSEYVRPYSILVNPPASGTTVSCSPTSIGLNQPSTCTATVTGSSPTGTVIFSATGSGSVSFSQPSCNLISGACSVTATGTSGGSLTIEASYSGDSNNTASSGTTSLIVTSGSTVSSTSVSCSPNSVSVDTPTTCSVTVSGSSPTGTVTLSSSSNTGTFSPSNSCILSVGFCAVSYEDSSTGTPTITANYGGDANNPPSSGKTTVTIGSSSGNVLKDQSSCQALGGTWDSSTSTCTVNTTLPIKPGTSLTISSGVTLVATLTLNNYGTINNAGTLTSDDKIFNFGGATIDNNPSGTININWFNNTGSISNSGTLINQQYLDNHGGTVDNFGTFDNNGYTQNSNGGSIDSVNTINNPDLITNDVGSTLINSGTINDFPGEINNAGGTFNNLGTVNEGNSATGGGIIANSGTITNSGTLDINLSSSLINGNNAIIDNLSGSFINITGADGDFSNSGIVNNSGTINNFSTGRGGQALYNSSGGTINNKGTINDYSSSIFNNSGITTNSGTIDNSGAIENYGTMNNQPGATINNPGTIQDYCNSTFTNNGTLTGNTIVNTCSNTASISLSPMSGNVGTAVTVEGTGFSSSATIVIKYNGTAVVTTPAVITTTSAGSFTATFTVPASQTGQTTVSATDGVNVATTTFTVIPSSSPGCPTTNSPSVDNYSTAGAETLTLSPGSCSYFFVGSTAGGYPMNNISWNPDLNVTASYSGNLAISIGHQTGNTGSYYSQAANHGIAGVGVSGFGGYSTFTASTPNSDSMSTSFTINSNDLVLIMVGGEGDANLALSGITAHTLENATYSEAGSNVIASEAIYEAHLAPGTYNINISSITYPTNGGTSLGMVIYDFHGISTPPPPPVTSITVGSNPNGIAFSPANDDVYVANSGSNTVSVISSSTNNVIATVNVGSSPCEVAYDPANQDVYVTNSGSNSVSVIRTSDNTVVATIPVGTGPCNLAYDPTNQEIYIANSGNSPGPSNTVSAISSATNTVVATITVDPNPIRLAFDPANNDIYVDDYASGEVTVIDGSNNVIKTISVGANPNAVGYDPANNDMYVTMNNSNQTVVIDSGTNNVVTTLNVGPNPFGVFYDPANSEVYVSSTLGNTVSAISASNSMTTVNVGAAPYHIVFDPADNDMYVLNTAALSGGGTPTISVIGGSNTVVTTLTATPYPNYGVFAPSSNDIYVTDYSSGSVSVISPLGTPAPTPTTTSLSSSQNPSTFGQSVALTATVSPIPSNGDTVAFFDGSSSIGTGTTNSAGETTLVTPALTVGSHSITATFGGDPNYSKSTSSALIQIVNPITTTTKVTSSHDPSVYGQPVNFTASVSPNNATGTMQFEIDNSNFGSPTAVVGGIAKSNMATLSVGSHTINATFYPNGPDYTGSTSQILQIVNKGGTTTSLASSANPSTYGQPVNFTATVYSVSPSNGIPTGNVTFYDGTTALGSIVLSGDKAAFSTSSLTVNTHQIIASYSGDADFNSSKSTSVAQIINPPPPVISSPSNGTIIITPLSNSSSLAIISGTALPGSSVIVYDGSTALGTASASTGNWTFTATLALGNHTITATANLNSLTSAPSNTVSITVVTSQEATTSLGNQVQSYGSNGGPLNSGQVNSLQAKLNNIVAKLNSGQVTSGCNQLTAFINEVQSYIQQGILTQSQGNSLINQAKAIQAAIPC